ncbi:MAG: NfeD family protein [Devosia sp.]|nr:NfeD family protein [Devosia sp.]
MQVIDFIASNGPWAWLVAGLILLALELVVPGGFLLWMGIAGIVTGLVALLQPVGWPGQWLIFGVLSLVSIALWVRWSRSRPATTDRPYLNRRADQLIGQEAVLEMPIVQGFGRVVLGDTVWRVSGPELPVGHRVRIVGNLGAVLSVEPVS